MNRLEWEIHRMWRGEGGLIRLMLAAGTAPLAVGFGAAVRVRNLLYDSGALPVRSAPIPVVSVGNLAVGGTGKTPVTAWVARTLRSAGRKPAIVMRGYGEDEVRLHRRWNPEVPVLPNPDRSGGVREAAARGRDVAVVDDGFQHRRIHRDLDLLLLSPAHPLPIRLLPRGPFRESLGAIRRADRVLVTAKGAQELDPARALADELGRIRGGPPVEVFAFRAGGWEAVDGVPAEPPQGEPFVVASVAEPEGFIRLVREKLGSPPRRLLFRDHHPFAEVDAARISRAVGDGWIAATEKDAVKLLPLRDLLPEVRVLPLVPVPPDDLAPAILDAVTRATARSPTE